MKTITIYALLASALPVLHSQTADPVVLRIQAGQVAAHVSPMLYGLMTEEINYSYDGGLYAELVRNRSFKAVSYTHLTLPTNREV